MRLWKEDMLERTRLPSLIKLQLKKLESGHDSETNS